VNRLYLLIALGGVLVALVVCALVGADLTVLPALATALVGALAGATLPTPTPTSTAELEPPALAPSKSPAIVP
jgi:hypothetical protein